ncbi:MAG: TerC family protein [Chthoniobacteraceae bacterium]
MNWPDPGTLAKFVQIVLTDLVLAGDNALVIALATRSLPSSQRFWGQIFGAGGAVGLRVLFVFLITWLTSIPILQLIAGVVLLWVAWKLVRPQEEALEAAAHPEHGGRHNASSLWHAVRLIIVADVIMSLDNVIAIAGIAKEGSSSPHGEMGLVIFGLLLSIPLVVCGSALISKLMSRFRWVIWLGGGVLGHVAGKIIFQDPRVLGWLGVQAKTGMPETEIRGLLDASDAWVRLVVHGLPWFFAVLLFVLGAWWSWHSLPANGADAPRDQ